MKFKYTPTDSDLLTLRIFMILLVVMFVIGIGFLLTTCTQTDEIYTVDSDFETQNQLPEKPGAILGRGITGGTRHPVPDFDSENMMFLDTEEVVIPDPLEKVTNDYFIDDVFVQEE